MPFPIEDPPDLEEIKASGLMTFDLRLFQEIPAVSMENPKDLFPSNAT